MLKEKERDPQIELEKLKGKSFFIMDRIKSSNPEQRIRSSEILKNEDELVVGRKTMTVFSSFFFFAFIYSRMHPRACVPSNNDVGVCWAVGCYKPIFFLPYSMLSKITNGQ